MTIPIGRFVNYRVVYHIYSSLFGGSYIMDRIEEIELNRETDKQFKDRLRQVFNDSLDIQCTDKLWDTIYTALWDGDYFLERLQVEKNLKRLIEIINSVGEEVCSYTKNDI